MDGRTDHELLTATAAGDLTAFGLVFERYARAVLTFHAGRTHDPAVAADLTSETFAAALTAAHAYRPLTPSAGPWLFGIARRKLADARRTGAVERRARERLGMRALLVTEEDLDRIHALADLARGGSPALDELDRLPPSQREAVRARILDEREYPEIARGLACSEAVVRQRVSVGLRALRGRVQEREAAA
jgi:RNA polymerase sigma factor (sigma-70 family)